MRGLMGVFNIVMKCNEVVYSFCCVAICECIDLFFSTDSSNLRERQMKFCSFSQILPVFVVVLRQAARRALRQGRRHEGRRVHRAPARSLLQQEREHVRVTYFFWFIFVRNETPQKQTTREGVCTYASLEGQA